MPVIRLKPLSCAVHCIHHFLMGNPKFAPYLFDAAFPFFFRHIFHLPFCQVDFFFWLKSALPSRICTVKAALRTAFGEINYLENLSSGSRLLRRARAF